MKKNNKKIIYIGILVSLFLFVSFIFIKNINQNVISNQVYLQNTNNTNENGKIFLEINDNKLETTISKEESVYDLMEQLQKEGKINFKEKTYSGMGKFIEEINEIKNGDKSWIYYVNGVKANVGVSNYKLINGDMVSWKYESQY